MALTDKLSAIGTAIREKTGGSDLLTLDAMPEAIRSISGGGGGDVPAEALVISGDCVYKFSGNGWNWFINDYGDQITTSDITNSQYMFYNNSQITEIPFTLNFQQGFVIYSAESMFNGCNNLTKLPATNNFLINNVGSMFGNCSNLREINQEFLDGIDYSHIENATSWDVGMAASMFTGCTSLRSIPMEFLRRTYNPITDSSWMYFQSAFFGCRVLDELVDLPISEGSTNLDWDVLTSTFQGCNRLKNLTFETNEDGTPKVMNWCGQQICLVDYVGWGPESSYITNFNSGITADKQVKDDTTYQALKNDPDWFSCDVNYSRYNHDSAVATINSLPDTSEYVVSMDSPNMITFTGAAGALTDGGAINTLTEEEIAVAAARGWTVSLV